MIGKQRATGAEWSTHMARHRINTRKLSGTDSGLRCSWNYRTGGFDEVVPIEAHEVINPDGEIVAVFWNNAHSIEGNRDYSWVLALRELRKRNATV